MGPFKSKYDKASLKEFLSKFKYIAVRDYSSLELATNIDLVSNTRVSFCFDPAILITEVFPVLKEKRQSNKNKKKIGVSVCHYERYVNGDLEAEKQREDAMLLFINKIIQNDDNVQEIILLFLMETRKTEISKSLTDL